MPKTTRTLPLKWDDPGLQPATMANQFMLQVAGDDQQVFFAFGQSAPPFLSGDTASQNEQLKKVHNVAVRVIGRYSLSFHSLRQLHQILGQMLELIESGADAEPQKDDATT